MKEWKEVSFMMISNWKKLIGFVVYVKIFQHCKGSACNPVLLVNIFHSIDSWMANTISSSKWWINICVDETYASHMIIYNK